LKDPRKKREGKKKKKDGVGNSRERGKREGKEEDASFGPISRAVKTRREGGERKSVQPRGRKKGWAHPSS